MSATETSSRPRRASAKKDSGGTTAPEEPKKGKQDTVYVILKGTETGIEDEGGANGEITWVRVPGVTEASNKEAARSKYLATLADGEGLKNGIWKAVASSAWAGSEKVTEVVEPKLDRQEMKD